MPRRTLAPALSLALTLLAGCARSKAPPAEAPRAAADEKLFDDSAVRSRSGGAAGTAERPVPRCGPQDSYRYVAAEFRCPGGGNPLGGDVAAARAARAGSIGPDAQGHMIDVYEVACPSGKVNVFVDMYGCPEMQPAAGGVESDPLQIDAMFAAGRYDEVRARCSGLPEQTAEISVFNCSVLMPAVLVRAGEEERAVSQVGRTCQAFPPPGPHSDVRVELLVAVVDAVARMWASDGIALDAGTRKLSALLPKLLSACGVESAAFMTAFEAATGPARP